MTRSQARAAEPAGAGRAGGGALLAVSLLVVAANLRPAVVGVAPVLGDIRADLGVSAAVAGLLTTLPVLCFGLLAPVTPALSRRLGVEPLLLVALLVLLGGIALRLVPVIGVLLPAGLLVGAAVAVGNVSMPTLVKRDFAHRTGAMTGAYSMVLSGGGALAAATTVPIQHALGSGWAPALASWGLLTVVALVLWTPQALRSRRGTPEVPAVGATAGSSALWRGPLAWRVTLFMGLQSLHYFALTAWVPTLFVEAGRTPAEAGYLLSLAGVVALAASLVAPMIATRRPSQSGLVAGLCALYSVGYGGLLVAPAAGAMVWMVVLGAAQGSMIALGLLLITLRAPDARRAGELAGMAQGVGYTLASVGPAGLGAVHDLSGSWTVPLVVMLVLVVPVTLAGVGAGRNRQVGGARSS